MPLGKPGEKKLNGTYQLLVYADDASVLGYNIMPRSICDYRRDMDLMLHLLKQLGTTSNYSTIANLHNSQITTALAKIFQVCCVVTSRSLASASNSGDPSASRPQSLSSQPPVQNSLSTESESESYVTTDGSVGQSVLE
jgi:hypothetical protein